MMIYRLKCKNKEKQINTKVIHAKSNKPMVTGICSSCGTKLCQFIKMG